MVFKKFKRVFDKSVMIEWKDMNKRLNLIEDYLVHVRNWMSLLEDATDAREILVALEEVIDKIGIIDNDIMTLNLVLDRFRSSLYDLGEAAQIEKDKVEGLLDEIDEPSGDNKGK